VADDDAVTTILTSLGAEPKAFFISLSTGKKTEIDKALFTVGRKQDSVDFYIENSSAVSRRHAEIIRDSGKYYIKDLESKNKTFINDGAIEPSTAVELKDGQLIRFGDAEFKFLIEEAN
jgi:pSer/pThr/pTyr-binding forkhead associated (FHA) protein